MATSSAPPALSPDVRLALITEAARKSAVCWLSYRYDDEAAVLDRLVWHVWHDGAIVVLSCPTTAAVDGGPGAVPEQELPALDRARDVEVTLRSRETGGRLVRWPASLEVLVPGTEGWNRGSAALLGARLNLPDPDVTRRAWAQHGTVVRLTPPLP